MIRSVISAMSTRAQQRPIIAVIGTTGVGKSQLAVSLGQDVGAVDGYQRACILSADSMQLYEGLNVITNKVTEEEKGGVEHWGLDVVRPGEGGSWELGKWCTEAGKKVSAAAFPSADLQMDSLSPSTLPIICGGTHYFIQHFLFPPKELSLERPREQIEARNSGPLAIRWTPPGPCPPTPQPMDPHLERLLNSFWLPNATYPPESDAEPSSANGDVVPCSRPTVQSHHELLSLWRVLDSVDPNEARRWHWKDGRKVRRGIERWWERGGGRLQVHASAPDGAREAR